jgi:hypothetical protein
MTAEQARCVLAVLLAGCTQPRTPPPPEAAREPDAAAASPPLADVAPVFDAAPEPDVPAASDAAPEIIPYVPFDPTKDRPPFDSKRRTRCQHWIEDGGGGCVPWTEGHW